VPSAKCIARPSRAAPPPRPQEEGYTSAEEGKPAGDVKDAGYNPAKATSYDAPRFAHPSPMRVAFANMHNAYGTAVASHWYAKPDAHVQQQVPPACGSFCNTMYPGPFCMPMQLHPVQLGPQMVQPHLQQPMTGMYVQPPIYGQIPAPTTSATYGQTMSPVSAAPYGLGAAPVSAASYAQASGSAVPYGQATAPVGTTSYGTHMPVNVAPFTQPRAVTCGSAIGPPMMPSCSQPELGSYPPPLVRPRPQQPMPVTMPICSQSVAPSHQPASVKTREEHNCAAQVCALTGWHCAI